MADNTLAPAPEFFKTEPTPTAPLDAEGKPVFWSDAPKPTPPTASPFWQDKPAPATAGKPGDLWASIAAAGAGGTPEQALAFIEERVRLGQITEQQATEMLKARNEEAFDKDGQYVQNPVDDRSEQAREFDATFAPAQPSEIKIDLVGKIPAGADLAKVGEFSKVAAEWGSEIGLPAPIATSFLERAVSVGQAAMKMTPVQRELYKAEQKAIFNRQHGERAQAVRIHALQVLLHGAKNSADFANALIQAPGIIDDAMIMSWLGLHGERLAARSKM